MNPLLQLKELGQSVWLDDLGRHYLDDGSLAALIHNDGVSGITSNPAIFNRAISQSGIYDAAIRSYAEQGDSSDAIYERLVIEDIQRAADLLRDTWRATDSRDGYVSLEVSPHLADDSKATIDDARRLWAAVDRPNLMIKVPGTAAGLPAITALIAAGINVNVTLLFSPSRYCQVVDAYWAGLERRLGAGHSLQGVASVASFFISRIDSLADGLLDRQSADSPQRGTAALTAAAMAYSHFLELHGNTRWQELAAAGAQHQRLLWASTSTKDPRYSELKYIEALIVGDTINTMPLETLEAYREHGEPALRLDQALDRSTQWNQKLVEQGIILEALAVQLEREGIEKFIDPYDRLLEELEHKRLQVLGRSA